jgi:hypothetical protein
VYLYLRVEAFTVNECNEVFLGNKPCKHAVKLNVLDTVSASIIRADDVCCHYIKTWKRKVTNMTLNLLCDEQIGCLSPPRKYDETEL